jgi:hypothetical protein
MYDAYPTESNFRGDLPKVKKLRDDIFVGAFY